MYLLGSIYVQKQIRLKVPTHLPKYIISYPGASNLEAINPTTCWWITKRETAQ